MSQVIGLAYVTPTSLRLVVRNRGYDARVFPGDTDWQRFLSGGTKKKPVAIVEDKRQFKKAVEMDCPLVVVCVNDLEWLERRGIRCLDARRENGVPKILNVTPAQIYTELGKTSVYTRSTTDLWLTKSNPAGRCAGCQHLKKTCVHEPTPTSRRPCGDEWAADTGNVAYRTFNLSQLVHLALNSATEDKLMDPPREFWRATYLFACGKMTRNEWITNHARLLKSAGASKTHLQNIALWVKRYGPVLQQELSRRRHGEKEI